MPTNFADAIREGGGPAEWIWKGDNTAKYAQIDVEVNVRAVKRSLRHQLAFTSVQQRVEVIEEAIEDLKPNEGDKDARVYYRLQRGSRAAIIRSPLRVGDPRHAFIRKVPRDSISADESILSQRKDVDHYPELTEIGNRYSAIQTFREWTFGRLGPLRQPQPADLPEDRLLPDARNLALLLNQIEHRSGRRLNQLLRRFFSRVERVSTKVSGNAVQFYLHEQGFEDPIPPTRLSDGTLRFIALLATLLSPSPPPLVCIEEPELGLHPDAVALIAELLVEASDRMQLIVTTHSDALVSALTNQPDAIIACERPGAGTVLRRLEPTKLARWLDDYRLGDLWRMGELGANP
jgi:predicted ATPase